MDNNSQRIDELEKRIASLEKAVRSCTASSVLSKGGKPLLTMSEASELLGLKKQTISLLASRGKIPFYKPNGKNMYFDAEELNAWLRQRPEENAQEKGR